MAGIILLLSHKCGLVSQSKAGQGEWCNLLDMASGTKYFCHCLKYSQYTWTFVFCFIVDLFFVLFGATPSLFRNHSWRVLSLGWPHEVNILPLFYLSGPRTVHLWIGHIWKTREIRSKGIKTKWSVGFIGKEFQEEFILD